MTPPTPKTNEDIIEELNIKDRDIEIKVLEALQAKDNEAVLAVEIVTRNMEEAHRNEMIELVKYLEQQMYDIEPKKKERIISRLLTQLKDDLL